MRAKLGDVTENLDYKRVPIAQKDRADLEKLYPYYGAQGIVDYVDDYIFDGEYLLVAEDGENLRSRKNSIVTFAKGKFWVNNHAHILGEKAGTNLTYIYYLLKGLDLSGYITGSAQPKLTQENLSRLEIDIPDVQCQKDVATLLSTIDAKIDNNNAIAAELEGMAKDLYDYWFVQFDFPDENGKPYKSSGGKMVWNDELKREIPEGWENGIVSDLGTVVTGGTPSTGCAEYFAKSKSGHAWATPKDLSNLNGRYFYHGEADITDAGLKNSAGNIMPKGSVLFTTRAPIGYIAITANEACTNQGFKSIIPAKKFGTEFVFQTLKMLTPQMQRVGVGSTFKEVSKDVFSHQSIVIPSVNLLKKYAALTLDIAEKIRNTQEENVELTSLRDFLLPMLMNGQVKVKGA